MPYSGTILFLRSRESTSTSAREYCFPLLCSANVNCFVSASQCDALERGKQRFPEFFLRIYQKSDSYEYKKCYGLEPFCSNLITPQKPLVISAISKMYFYDLASRFFVLEFSSQKRHFPPVPGFAPMSAQLGSRKVSIMRQEYKT